MLDPCHGEPDATLYEWEIIGGRLKTYERVSVSKWQLMICTCLSAVAKVRRATGWRDVYFPLGAKKK